MADAFQRTQSKRNCRARARLAEQTRAEIEQGIEEHEDNVIEAADVCGRPDCWCASKEKPNG